MVICYDSEFPLLSPARRPRPAPRSCSPPRHRNLAGFTRVRVGAMARALENQCVVVHSPLVGLRPGAPAVEENPAAPRSTAPPTAAGPRPASSPKARGRPGWAWPTSRLEAIAEVRRDGGVLNFAHWANRTPACKIGRNPRKTLIAGNIFLEILPFRRRIYLRARRDRAVQTDGVTMAKEELLEFPRRREGTPAECDVSGRAGKRP
jgi:hypothetical protein